MTRTWNCALCLCLVVAASPARAQRLVGAPSSPLPFQIDGTGTGPTSEGGAMLVFGHDVETTHAGSLRIDATSVTAGPGVGADVAAVVACGGARWLLTLTTSPQGRPVWSVGIENAPVVWSHVQPTDATLRCTDGHTVVGYVDDGELLTQVLAPTAGQVQRVRIAPRGAGAEIRWAAPALDELDVAVRMPTSGAIELLRVARGVVTHRRAVGVAPAFELALGPHGVLVATTDANDRDVTLRGYARADLTSGPAATIRGADGRSLSPIGLWAGPNGVVAVATIEGWSGHDFVRIPQGPREPDRYEPARHHAAAVRLWAPATAAVGPAIDLGPVDARTASWIGATFVMLLPVHPDTVVGGIVQLAPAELRRFTVTP